MRRPCIGVTTDYSESPKGRPYRRHELRAAYADAVARAGGLPLLLAPTEELALAVDLVDRLDALVVSGGDCDVPPAEYGESPAPCLGPLRPTRTSFELRLVAEADRRGLPILGICGGMQLLDVARGGKLYQHLPAELPGALAHEQAEDRRQPSHPVLVSAGTRLAGAVGTGEVRVNSAHHQGVRLLGRQLVASASSPDGLIEGIEDPGAPFFLGVQWHPELLIDSCPAQQRLFAQLIEAARGRG
ncbi:MAG: gamma-glutamyl-gamma-aminobutyrate hydrolase family protein [Myxococcales bacterium]